MSASPNCDSCGAPLRGEALFMARRSGELFFCPPCGAKRERRHVVILGALGVTFLAILILAITGLSSRVRALESQIQSLESRNRP